MILVDTSVWVDHLRHDEPVLARLLQDQQVLAHPFVIGELAVDTLRQRDIILAALRGLPQSEMASDGETQSLIDGQRLFGTGIGYVDAHLLAATRRSASARLWTRDRRLRDLAIRLALDADIEGRAATTEKR